MSGAVALVTGGGGGLGRAVGAALVARGDRVALLGRDASRLEAAAATLEGEVVPLAADVTDRTAVDAAVAAIARRWGPVTRLVNAAGTAASAPLLPPDDDLWTRTMAVNVTGPWIVATACLPGMLAAGGGAIVNVASTASLKGFRYTAAYVASKHAVLGLTRALAADLEGRGVTVRAVCPGFLDTPMTAGTVARIVETTDLDEPAARAALAAMNARRALVPPEEVAAVVVSLLGGEGTGEACVVVE
jgi:NAD(P)-dependent dehydrogenase (short-subunit alcohol dehydrogenase family)